MSVQEKLLKFGLTMEEVDAIIGDGEVPVTESEISGFNESFFQEIRNCVDYCRGKIPRKEHQSIHDETGREIGSREYDAYIHESYEDVVKRQKETGIQLITEDYHDILDSPINSNRFSQKHESGFNYNILTEDGIDVSASRNRRYITESKNIPEDNIIREGIIIEIARDAKRLLEAGDKDGLWDLIMEKEYKTLSSEHRLQLMNTHLSTGPWTLYQELDMIESDRTDAEYDADIMNTPITFD